MSSTIVLVSCILLIFSCRVCSGASGAERKNYHEALRAYRSIGNSVNQLFSHWLAASSEATLSRANYSLSGYSHALKRNLRVSSACMEKLDLIYEEIMSAYEERELPPQWVLQLVDAQAKPPANVLEGNIAWFGGFHECMNLTAYQNESNPTSDSLIMAGRYCLVSVGDDQMLSGPKVSPLLGVPKDLRLGLCVPENCSASDMRELLNLGLLVLQTNFPQLPLQNVSILDVTCPAKELKMDGAAIIVILVLVFFGTVVVVGSLYDILSNGIPSSDVNAGNLLNPYSGSTSTYTSLLPSETIGAAEQEAEVQEGRSILSRIGLAVSAVPHCRKLFSWERGVDDLRWIHGIRVLSMLWVILGQTYALGLPLYDNLLMIPEAMKGLFSQLIVQATFAVDTFLFLSGFLVTYRFLQELTSGFDCRHLLRFYVSRYLRLFPAYMIVLGIYAALTKYISSGPLWPQDEVMLGNCSHLAWTNAFYVNNFVQPEQMCMPWTWYIAIDFQLFIFAPLIVLCLFVFWQTGIAICGACVLAVVITSGIVSKLRELPPSLVGFGSTDISAFDQDLTLRYFTEYLITTYCRAAPYFVGITTAFCLRNPAEVPRLGLLLQVLGWIFAILGMSVVVFGLVPGFNGFPLSVDAAAAFNSLSHVVWSGALAWIAYICVTSSGGIVSRLLGWSSWTPLSTISYSTYLISPVMICVFYLSREETIRFSHYTAVNLFFGNLALSLLAGFLIYIFIEAPIRSLSKLALARRTTKIVAVVDSRI